VRVLSAESKRRKREYNAAYKKSAAGRLSALRYRLKWNYNMTLEEWQEAIAIQDGRCAICKKRRKLYVDHDHCTGEFRAGLCRRCNLLIGHANDDPVLLRKAAQYLEGFGPTGSNFERRAGRRMRMPEIEKVYR